MAERVTHRASDLSDALRTIAVNGAYDASRSLSKWLRKGVHLRTDGFARVPLNEVCQGSEMNEPVVALYMQLTGQLHGHTLLAIPTKTALELVDMLAGAVPGTTCELNDLAKSCLEETANIVSNAFTNSWAKCLDVFSELRPPQLRVDFLEVILEAMLIEQAMISDEICLAKTSFNVDGRTLDWDYYLLPTRESLRLIEHSLA